MKYIDTYQLKAEIERRLSNIVTGLDFTAEIELKELLSFLDTLPEQPVEGLEEEIENYYGRMPDDTDKIESARHFAEWGEKNAYKSIMKKADEVRDKRFDTDYEVKIEPAAGFDLGCVNVYHEGKLVGQYVEPKEEKKLPEGLEEAAREYAKEYTKNEGNGGDDWEDDIQITFKAGAEWQKKKTAWIYLKEAKDAVIALEKEKGEPLNPRVAFVNGARWQKQQMLEEAVEGLVEELYNDGESQCTVGVGTYFKPGEEVYVIKKED